MAALKLLFCLCVTVFFTYAQVSELHIRPDLKDAKSDALALLEELEQSLRQAAAVVLPQVHDLYQLLDNTAVAVIADSKENVEAEIKPFLKDIQELQIEADALGINITECIGNSIQDINALPAQFLSKVSLCVERRVMTSKGYINQSIADIDSTLDIVADFANQINVCGNESSVEQEQCFKEVSANITENIATLPIQIIYDGATLRTFVYSAIPEIAMCTVGILDDLDETGDKIVDNVTVCVAEKINGTLVASLDYFNY